MRHRTFSFILALPVMLFSMNVNAQEGVGKKQTELGFTTNSLTSLDNFSIELKRGKDNRYVRYSLLVLSGNANIYNLNNFDSPDESAFIGNTNIGAGIGWEKRRVLKPRLQFLHGPNFAIYGSYRNQTSETPGLDHTEQEVSGTASFGWRLGMMYSFADNVYCSAEINPGVSYTLTYTDEVFGATDQQRTSFRQIPSFSISNGGLRLGLFYRF